MSDSLVVRDRFEIASRLAGAALVLLGLVVLWGLTVGVPGPTRIVGSLPAMRPNTAVGLLLLGLALATPTGARGAESWTTLRRAAVWIALGLSAFTLCEHVLGFATPLDRWLVPVASDDHDGTPARMSVIAALDLLLLSLALLLQERSVPGRRAAFEYPCLAVLITSILVLFGLLFGANGFQSAFRFSGPIALPTAVSHLVAAIAILSRYPDRGRIALLAQQGEAAALARHWVARGAATMLTITILAQWGFSLGWYDAGYRDALVSTSLMSLGIIAVWSDLQRLLRAERTTDEALAQFREARDTLEGTVQSRTAALRRTADELNSLVDSSPLAIVSVACDGTVLRWNPAAEVVFGWSAAETVGGPLPSIPGELREEADGWWARAFAGEALAGLETRRRQKSGALADVALSIAPIRDPAGEVTSIVFLYLDISARKRTEAQLSQYVAEVVESRSLAEVQAAEMSTLAEELQVARNEALESARLKASFLATMSHEIRTPLNGVIGMTGLLLDTGLTGAQRRFAETARSSGEALLGLINDILDFSKIEAGKLTLERTEVAIRGTVEDVVDLLAERAQARGNELLSSTGADVPAVVHCDGGRIRQVLINLVGNAVKFTEGGEICVRVGVGARDDGTRELRFEVSDTGIGMTQDAIGRLFEAFTQADASTSRKYGGTGLGLAISKQIVEAMGGRIGVRSEAGAGSTFWFTIALSGEPVAAATEVPAADLTGVRVLCVDDRPQAAELLAEELRRWGATVTTAGSSRAAYAALRAGAASGHPVELVLVDRDMPAPDGLALAAVIREDASLENTPIVLLKELSAGQDDADLLRLVGATVTKPVRRAALAEAIAAVRGVPGPSAALAVDPAAAPTGPSLRILLAEDNGVNQIVATQTLLNLGHRVDVAANGIEARDAVRMIAYDLVLMDCEMPEMDGYQATRAIRAAEVGESRIPIIAMTAHALDGDRQRCLASGMDDYLSKPFNPRRLQQLLQRWAAAGPSRAAVDVLQPAETAPLGTDGTTVLDLEMLGNLRDLDVEAPGILGELVGLFLKELPCRLEGMSRGSVRGDGPAVAGSAHALRGSAGNLGASRLAAVCCRVEQAARREDWDAVCDALAGVRVEAQAAAGALSAEAGAGAR